MSVPPTHETIVILTCILVLFVMFMVRALSIYDEFLLANIVTIESAYHGIVLSRVYKGIICVVV
jgi:hypothetical protein